MTHFYKRDLIVAVDNNDTTVSFLWRLWIGDDAKDRQSERDSTEATKSRDEISRAFCIHSDKLPNWPFETTGDDDSVYYRLPVNLATRTACETCIDLFSQWLVKCEEIARQDWPKNFVRSFND